MGFRVMRNLWTKYRGSDAEDKSIYLQYIAYRSFLRFITYILPVHLSARVRIHISIKLSQYGRNIQYNLTNIAISRLRPIIPVHENLDTAYKVIHGENYTLTSH